MLVCVAKGMTDVPDIPLEQIQQRVVAMWMGSFYGSSGYVARKLGKKGLREFQDIGARQVAATFKQLGLTEPEQWHWPMQPMIRTFSEAWWKSLPGRALWRSNAIAAD